MCESELGGAMELVDKFVARPQPQRENGNGRREQPPSI
jgi:hypothetical protein